MHKDILQVYKEFIHTNNDFRVAAMQLSECSNYDYKTCEKTLVFAATLSRDEDGIIDWYDAFCFYEHLINYKAMIDKVRLESHN